MHTGRWVRAAGASREPVIVLDRGRPTARLLSLEDTGGTAFSSRRKVAGCFGELSPEVSLRAADALHLMCAKLAGLEEIFTNDRHRLAASGFVGLRGRNLLAEAAPRD